MGEHRDAATRLERSIYAGTAGWSVPRALATTFASDTTHLSRYARTLDAVEINSTFFRRHRPATFERWAASVPEHFRFAVKAPRTITHDASLLVPRVVADPPRPHAALESAGSSSLVYMRLHGTPRV